MPSVKKNKLNFKIMILLLLGFASIEFPGIFLINKIEPFIFGMPFIYSFVLIVWACMCTVLFYGYKKKWGEKTRK